MATHLGDARGTWFLDLDEGIKVITATTVLRRLREIRLAYKFRIGIRRGCGTTRWLAKKAGSSSVENIADSYRRRGVD